MTAGEVYQKHGAPTEVTYMQAFGCVVQRYDQLEVQLCQEVVKSVSAERCPK